MSKNLRVIDGDGTFGETEQAVMMLLEGNIKASVAMFFTHGDCFMTLDCGWLRHRNQSRSGSQFLMSPAFIKSVYTDVACSLLIQDRYW